MNDTGIYISDDDIIDSGIATVNTAGISIRDRLNMRGKCVRYYILRSDNIDSTDG